ncbi:PREDICTED: ankyrin [Prunus dulcis]|uniref:PREDICTED: ankyrin n=1 Tax=Prunus dulcis TaxID=3755 RepID=A0A5E4E360_PRUDU|nr:PREDICTED: ankyrin [Prunus dulcis]
MSAEALAARTSMGQTALHFVAVSGDDSIEAARALVTRNPALPQITDSTGATPHYWACLVAPETSLEMRWYLVLATTDDFPSCPFTGPLAGSLICSLSIQGFFGKRLIIELHV